MSTGKFIILETFSIVLGVLLALGANQWNENRIRNNQLESAIVMVTDEIRENQKVLEIKHGKNSQILTDTTGSDVEFTPAIQLRANAWQTMQTTGLSTNMDYKQLIKISELYSFQSVYKGMGEKLINAHLLASSISSIIGTKTDNDSQNETLLTDIKLIVELETVLLESFNSTLESLNNNQDF